MNWKFRPGDRVVKTSGYPFPGVVEAAFLVSNVTPSRADRYVVNFVSGDGLGQPTGLLHIFAPGQLARDGRFEAKEDGP